MADLVIVKVKKRTWLFVNSSTFHRSPESDYHFLTIEQMVPIWALHTVINFDAVARRRLPADGEASDAQRPALPTSTVRV